MNIMDFDTNYDYVFIIEGVVNDEEFFGFPDCADYEDVEPIDYYYYYDYYDYYYDYRVSLDNDDKPKRPLGSWFHKIDEEFGVNKNKDVKRKHRKSNNRQNKRNKKRKNEKRQNKKNNNQKNKNSNPNKTNNKRQFGFEYPFPIITVSINTVPI